MDTRALLGTIAAELAKRAPKRAEKQTYNSQAAVSLLLRPAAAGLEFLAIRRTENERDPWSGHMALPGGRREPGDDSLRMTAIRETLEEVGVDLSSEGTLLGQLDDVAPRTRRIPAIAITPFVFGVEPAVVARTSSEVEKAVWLPLRVIVDETHRGILTLEVLPDREFPTIEYRGHVIWGLTLSILRQVERILQDIGYAGGGA